MSIVKKNIRLHLTNINGLGSSLLLKSMLPHLISDTRIKIAKIYVGNKQGALANGFDDQKIIFHYKRILPNIISRFIECIFFEFFYRDNSLLLVFGDIPLRVRCKQVLFFQNSLLVNNENNDASMFSVKIFFQKLLFSINQNYITTLVVQSEYMKSRVLKSYPLLAGRVRVISHPPPQASLENILEGERVAESCHLELIYPASFYPHKNHILLKELLNLLGSRSVDTSFLSILLTINKENLPWATDPVKFCGVLSQIDLMDEYTRVSGLIFLSLAESYGFPLVEAMLKGLPIICPRLEYARAICGSEAIYFESSNAESLLEAILELDARLKSGWKPDWTNALVNIPKDWCAATARLVDLLVEA